MNDNQVVALARLALSGMAREYPNKPSNTMVGPESVQSPRQMHPAFFGCFDWHSAVHGHWMLVRLLREYPDCSIADEIRAALDEQLTRENLAAEADYFQQEQSRHFERMYGWAWLLRLVAELHAWDDPQGNRWREHLRPLEDIIVQRIKHYLPLLQFPIRTGVHPDTAFALGQELDYARIVGDTELEQLIVTRAHDYYLADKDYPAKYEPSGEDFFSPGLNEADLMRRVLSVGQFSEWLEEFLPGIQQSGDNPLLSPVEVSDVTDGKIVHLAGLDLSRGWCLHALAHSLSESDPRGAVFRQAAEVHAEMGFRYVFSGHYEGEHWLATFAVYLLTGVGKP